MRDALKAFLRTTPIYTPYFIWSRTRALRSNSAEQENLVTHYRSFLKPGDLAFDIGANIGNRTRAFLSIGCRVVAVEPQANCVAVMRRAFGDRVAIVPAAISDQDGVGTIRISSVGTLTSMAEDWIAKTQSSGRNAHQRWAAGQSIATRSLDSLIAEHGEPQFIKIDVEGHERSVLSGLSRPVPALSYELTPEIIEDAIACAERLSQIGDYRYNVSFGESLIFEFAEWQEKAAIADFLLSLRGYFLRYGDVYAKLAM